MTARATGARFRQRKLSTKQNLPVVREHEVEQLADDDASRHIPKVETGVEKGEEIVSFPLSHFGLPSFTPIIATRCTYNSNDAACREPSHYLLFATIAAY
jgi:hypothetical protein